MFPSRNIVSRPRFGSLHGNSDNSKQLETIINQELFKVKAWCDVNKLSINFSKTNFMIIKSPQKRLNTPINIIFHVVIVR